MLDSKWWEDLLLPSPKSPTIRVVFLLLILGILIPVVVSSFPSIRSDIIDIPLARVISLILIVFGVFLLIGKLSIHQGARWIISTGLVFIALCRIIFIVVQSGRVVGAELNEILPMAADLLGSAGSLMVVAGFGITVRQVLRARSLLLNQNEQLVQEIEHRTRAEEALRASEEKYRTLIEFSGDSVFVVDHDGNITFSNPTGKARILELGGGKCACTLREISAGNDDYMWRMGEIRAVMESGIPRMVEDSFYRAGNDIYVLSTIQPLPEKAGNKRSVLVMARDITDRKRNEAEIRRLAAAIAQAGEAILITRTDLTVAYANPAVERLTGYSGDDLLGRYGNAPEVQPCVLALAAGQSWQGAFSLTPKVGETVSLAVTAYPVRSESGERESYVVLMRDVTHEMTLERQLRQAQKMEAIGTLAGGVAHEFNNLLGAIMGHAELLLDELYEMEKYRESAQAIIGASERASEIVAQILAFSRPAEVRSEPLDIRLVVRETLRLLRASLPSNIEIRERIGSDLGVVHADLTQIQQVLMNLGNNAGYAMRGHRGVLEISLARCLFPDGLQRTLPPLSPGVYVELAVRDTGDGIDRETIEKIFDPYFTTKPAGEGTGMGLSIVSGIIKAHGGGIAVHSAVGEGTTFSIYLPKHEREAASGNARVRPVTPVGTERIMLVDDEESLVEMLERALSKLGYTVIAFSDSEAALAAFTQNPDAVDIVITDYTMPQMTGIDFAEAVLRVRPDMPVILTSGYAEVIARESERITRLTRKTLPKPVKIHVLGCALREVLDATYPKSV